MSKTEAVNQPLIYVYPIIIFYHYEKELMNIKYILMVLALFSTQVFAEVFESTSEFRACARTYNEVDVLHDRYEQRKSEMDEFSDRIDTAQNQLNIMRPFSYEYNAKQRFIAAQMQYNVMVAEYNNQLPGYNRLRKRFDDQRQSFINDCGDKQVRKGSGMWNDVCVESSSYQNFCSKF